jgi:phosphatidylglycerophosphate synthase
MRQYQYRSNDKSFLTPAFKQWIVAPLITYVPWAIPANIITFLSNGFVYLALYLTLRGEPVIDSITRLCIAICLLLYLIGDHLDGMQAKRTGTGSALGEFCDHYLDAFNNGIIVFIMLCVFQISSPYIICFTLVASYLAHLSVFYEQLKTGWLTFEKIGSLEGVLFALVAISLSSMPIVDEYLLRKVIFETSVYDLLMLTSSVGACLTFYTTYKRTPQVKYGFWFFAILLMVLAALSMAQFSNTQVFVIITLYASLYIGRIMRGHLIDGVERSSDLIAPLLLTATFFVSYRAPLDYSFFVISSYLTVCIIYLIVKTFSVLKTYWVWRNVKR